MMTKTERVWKRISARRIKTDDFMDAVIKAAVREGVNNYEAEKILQRANYLLLVRLGGEMVEERKLWKWFKEAEAAAAKRKREAAALKRSSKPLFA